MDDLELSFLEKIEDIPPLGTGLDQYSSLLEFCADCKKPLNLKTPRKRRKCPSSLKICRSCRKPAPKPLTAAQEQQKLKNRISAQQSRDRRKQYMADLQTQNQHLKSLNQQFSIQIEELQSENQLLKEKLHLKDSFTPIMKSALTLTTLLSVCLLASHIEGVPGLSPLDLTVFKDPQGLSLLEVSFPVFQSIEVDLHRLQSSKQVELQVAEVSILSSHLRLEFPTLEIQPKTRLSSLMKAMIRNVSIQMENYNILHHVKKIYQKFCQGCRKQIGNLKIHIQKRMKKSFTSF